MKITLNCGEVEIKPLPVSADRVIELLENLQSLGSKDNAYATKKAIALEIIYFAGKSQEDLIMSDILFLLENFNALIAAALPMPVAPLAERVSRPGDEVLRTSEEAYTALKALGVPHG